jgi:hypothetical protein
LSLREEARSRKLPALGAANVTLFDKEFAAPRHSCSGAVAAFANNSPAQAGSLMTLPIKNHQYRSTPVQQDPEMGG